MKSFRDKIETSPSVFFFSRNGPKKSPKKSRREAPEFFLDFFLDGNFESGEKLSFGLFFGRKTEKNGPEGQQTALIGLVLYQLFAICPQNKKLASFLRKICVNFLCFGGRI